MKGGKISNCLAKVIYVDALSFKGGSYEEFKEKVGRLAREYNVIFYYSEKDDELEIITDTISGNKDFQELSKFVLFLYRKRFVVLCSEDRAGNFSGRGLNLSLPEQHIFQTLKELYERRSKNTFKGY